MNFLKRFPLYEILLVTVILAVHAYAALSDAYNLPNAWFTRDDAYYYFKVAQNITEGHGSTFDGINLTNGYHPLWMLVCIPVFALARYDLILPLRVLLMVMAILNSATAVLIYRLVHHALSRPVAMAAAAFWAFNAYIHDTVYEFGLETPLAAFAIMLLLYSIAIFESKWRLEKDSAGRIATLAVLTILMLFSRLDLIFFAVIAGFWLIFRGHALRFFLPLDLVILFFAMTSAIALRTGFPQYNLYAGPALSAVLASFVVKIPIFYFTGLYQHPRHSSTGQILCAVLPSTILASITTTFMFYCMQKIWNPVEFPRSALLLDWVLGTILIIAVRLAGRWFGNQQDSANVQEASPLLAIQKNWKFWLRDGTIFYGILGGALTLYMLWNTIVFNTSTPVSGQIKHWWGSFQETAYEGPASDWSAFFGLGYQWVYDAWQPASSLFLWLVKYLRPVIPGADTGDERYYLAMFLVSIAALAILILNRRNVIRPLTLLGLIPLMAGSGIQILSYTTTAYAGVKEWYWISQMILVTLTGSLILHLAFKPILSNRYGRTGLTMVAGIVCIYFAAAFGSRVVGSMPYNYFPPDRPYMEVLPFLEGATPPDSLIGMTGGGNVGYFIRDRTIINMDGLINSNEYFHALQRGEAPRYLKQKGMDIIFANPGLLNLAPYSGQFASFLERFGEYGGKALFYLLPEPKY
jgi:hypothetical protein